MNAKEARQNIIEIEYLHPCLKDPLLVNTASFFDLKLYAESKQVLKEEVKIVRNNPCKENTRGLQ